jgi:4-amino-4-deoxy-L-arabinose transferase-like glycosyltransferase
MSSQQQSARLPICQCAIILVAFALRVWALDSVPPGLTHDEAAHLHDAQRIWEGARPIYLTSAYGREPLYDYVSAPLVGLSGMRVLTGRLVSALWGTALVGLLYAWVARAFDRPTATLAAALMALSFWPLSTSRQILRSITMPVLLTAALLLFWQAVYPAPRRRGQEAAGRHQRRHFILTGALLGLSCYTYMPARITWLAPTLLGLGLALTDRPRWRRVRAGLGLMLLTMALVAAPLLLYLATHPALEVRVAELAAPLQALRDGDPGPLWARLRETATLLSHRGDVHWMYNLSGRPLLPPLWAGSFYLGLLILIVGLLRRRRPAYGLLLLWLLLGVAPALVTGLESSALRAIAAQPAVFVIAALPPVVLGRVLWPRLSLPARRVAVGLTGAALTLLGIGTANDYFNLWAGHRDTRVAYHAHVVAIARYLDTQPADTPVAISTLYPGPLHDPYVTDVALNRADLQTQWYDARFALVFPDASEARAVLPALAPLDDALRPWFEPTAQLLARVELQPDDLVPWFEVYTWQPRRAQAGLPLSDAVDVGHVVAFVGHRLNTPSVAPGGSVELLTCWRVLDPAQLAALDSQLVLFTHVLDAAGQIVGQRDRLDVPTWNWSPGDLFVQLHRFAIDDDLAPGLYSLEVGAYVRAAGYPRLPVYDPRNPAVVADHIPLPPLEVLDEPANEQ